MAIDLASRNLQYVVAKKKIIIIYNKIATEL